MPEFLEVYTVTAFSEKNNTQASFPKGKKALLINPDEDLD